MRLITTALAAVTVQIILSGCAATPNAPQINHASYEAEEASILAVLSQQDVSWNAGDIDGFMASYQNSPDLRFASGGAVTRGWTATNERYHARYNSRAKMGRLTTYDQEVVLLAPDAAVVHGRWKLERASDTPSGLYTLVMRKFGDDWRIVSDTTTSAD